jgi:hypothetical protein
MCKKRARGEGWAANTGEMRRAAPQPTRPGTKTVTPREIRGLAILARAQRHSAATEAAIPEAPAPFIQPYSCFSNVSRSSSAAAHTYATLPAYHWGGHRPPSPTGGDGFRGSMQPATAAIKWQSSDRLARSEWPLESRASQRRMAQLWRDGGCVVAGGAPGCVHHAPPSAG